LVVCFFSRGIYRPEVVQRTLGIVGYRMDENDLLMLGKEILRNKYEFKVREGFNLNKLRIPDRILQTPTPLGLIDKEELQNIITNYKELISENI